MADIPSHLYPHQPDLAEDALAAFAARDAAEELTERGHRIDLPRLRLFEDTLAGPVAAAVGPWTDGWRRLAAALREGRADVAVAELQALSAVLGQLQNYWENWEQARAKWYAEEAEPWNAEAGRRYGRFASLGPVPGCDTWQGRLSWQDGGPQALPDHILGCYLYDQAERFVPGGLFTDLRAVYAGLVRPDMAGQLIGGMKCRDRVADVVLAVGAMILPAPELLAALAADIEAADAWWDVYYMIRAAPDEVYRPLMAELQRRLDDRTRQRTAGLSTSLGGPGGPPKDTDAVRLGEATVAKSVHSESPNGNCYPTKDDDERDWTSATEALKQLPFIKGSYKGLTRFEKKYPGLLRTRKPSGQRKEVHRADIQNLAAQFAARGWEFMDTLDADALPPISPGVLTPGIVNGLIAGERAVRSKKQRK